MSYFQQLFFLKKVFNKYSFQQTNIQAYNSQMQKYFMINIITKIQSISSLINRTYCHCSFHTAVKMFASSFCNVYLFLPLQKNSVHYSLDNICPSCIQSVPDPYRVSGVRSVRRTGSGCGNYLFILSLNISEYNGSESLIFIGAPFACISWFALTH